MSVPPGTCQGCLTTGRYLYRLTEYYCLLKGLEIFQFHNASETVKVCWECKAKLRNMSLFINQVKTAQSVLEETTFNNTDLKSLSRLSIVKSETNSYDGDENNEIFSKTVEVKLEKIVEDSAYKHETANDYSDNLDDDNVDDPTIDQTVKLEETQTDEPRKYLRTNKKAKVKNKLMKAKLKSPRPILKAIQIKELSFWLERERNSDFYKTSLFNCLNCFKRFRCMKQYKQHMDTAHKPSKFVCEVCTIGFDTEADLRNHVPKHYFIRECKTCQYQCYGRSHMRYHLRQHITKKEYQCDQCRLTFSFMIELKRHYNALHRRCVCDVCGKSVTTKLMMEKHFKNHHTLIKCKECNTTYKNQKNYNAHFNLRHVKFPADFQELCYCVQCDIKFDNNALYRRHLQSSRAHRERDKVPCPECDKVYSRKTFMMNHYRLIHLNKTNFYCKLCDKYLLNSTRYNYHMKYQHQKLEKEKNKLCSICGRGFNTNRTLANHILTHTGERPYPCDICGARFSQKQAMQSHVKHVHFNVSRRKSR